MDLIAPRVLCVGTHHKTGTLWMRSVFRQLAETVGLESHLVYPTSGERVIPDADRVLLLNWSSAFPPAVLERPDARILHLIRDPRDVLLSGMRYHLRAKPDGEAFLHEGRGELAGRSYQEHLQSLAGEAERLVFEMDGKHAETLEEMLAWRSRRNTIEARYEALVGPSGAEIFRGHLRDLGLTEAEVGAGMQAFWDHSLTGRLADPELRRGRIRAHVSSGRPQQWRRDLPRSVAGRYAERYGQALVRLGYETHPTDWLEELRDAA